MCVKSGLDNQLIHYYKGDLAISEEENRIHVETTYSNGNNSYILDYSFRDECNSSYCSYSHSYSCSIAIVTTKVHVVNTANDIYWRLLLCAVGSSGNVAINIPLEADLLYSLSVQAHESRWLCWLKWLLRNNLCVVVLVILLNVIHERLELSGSPHPAPDYELTWLCWP